MAFNFKWSPLAADTDFYQRAKELLTTALNKSPKPPIIVDDIIVNELNLGEIPPDLEVLEIGDLDVDRFRGMFKMCYDGNAFLTLKTKVQANPLNTYLSTKPSFTSPQPLAAASGLTIPIQITLSEIKLSAFIILVYSSQKGVTLVFRNDPLESLKVSSTFDAIPFVREYLQKEIEGQLRVLLMDELPLIIHRLSLRFFDKEYQNDNGVQAIDTEPEEQVMNPLSSPPRDPVDLAGNIIDTSQITSLSLEPGSESLALFSQRNLLRLGALTQSHRTLSLFTPLLRDTVFRASAGSFERGEHGRASTKPTPAISRSQSYVGDPGTTYTFTSSSPNESHFSKSSLTGSSAASSTGLSRPPKAHGRRRKHRVVNLRKKAADGIDETSSVGAGSTTDSATGSDGAASAPAQFEARPRTPEMKEPGDADVGQTPPRLRDATSLGDSKGSLFPDPDETPRQSQYLPRPSGKAFDEGPSARRPALNKSQTLLPSHFSAAKTSSTRDHSQSPKKFDPSPFAESTQALPQLEQSAWMNRIADEILRKVHERKAEDSRFWDRRGSGSMEDPPPAYGS